MTLQEIQVFVNSLSGWVGPKERKSLAKGFKKAFGIKKSKLRLVK